MSDRVSINTQTAFGKALAEYVDVVMEARARGARLKDAFNSMAQGGTYAQVDAEVNGGSDAARGQTVYNILTGSVSALQGAEVNALVRIDQG